MATMSALTFSEKVVLPFCVFVPVSVGIVGYFTWKHDKHAVSTSATMTVRMAVWFAASCASMVGLSLFHVVRNLMAAQDYRIGMVSLAIALAAVMCAAIFTDALRITDDADLFLNSNNEVSDFIMLDNETTETTGPRLADIRKNVKQRYIVAALVYLVLVFQSAFDGLVLKYNPNAQSSATQVAMFYLSKFPESLVVSTALVHAAVRTKWYCLYMFNFTAAVGLSTIAAYGTVNPLIVVAIYEHWAFQIVLGASGGLLLALSYYFFHLESRRTTMLGQGMRAFYSVIAFVSMLGICCATGIFG